MAKRKAKDPRERQEQKKRRTGMLLSFFMICLLLLLTSSFVLRYIYRGASNVTLTPDGVAEIYQAATGQIVFNEDMPDENEEDEYDNSDEFYFEDQTLETEENIQNSQPSQIQDDTGNSSTKGYTDGTGVYDKQTGSGNSTQGNSNDSGSNSNSNSNGSGSSTDNMIKRD